MRFGVLGPLAVWTADGRPVRVPELKVRALLADLLVHGGGPVSADRLADDLWGDDPPGNPANTLQTKVSQLRRALDLAEPGARDLVVHRPGGYVLRVPADAVDAARFTALLDRARAEREPRVTADLLSEALGEWRGPAYADFRDAAFAGPAAARLEEQRLTALEERAEIRLDLGEHSLLADELGELVAEYPLRERLRAAHLRALYRAGRQTEALAAYEELRHRLADELGLDPGPALVAVQRAILTQDPALDAAPAAATSAARPGTNLPVPPPPLTGGDPAVTRVAALLADARLVTLTGPGGVGKTRLATATAARVAAGFPDGVWLADLSGRRPARATAAADAVGVVGEGVAPAIGRRDEPAGARAGVPAVPLSHRLADALRERRLLLVLDNCEHLVTPAAELVALLLRNAGASRVLATSQEPLDIPGETLHAVAPLDLPAPGADPDPAVLARAGAVQLFVARAPAAAPGFRLDAATAPWVAVVCRRLDGLPLALELAAARVRALGVRGLAERLDDRFRLPAARGGGGPARQRTLRAMIDWSWEHLAEPERVVLRRIAAHPGGCAPEAAEAVCAEPGFAAGEVTDALARLVDRSMVVAEPAPDGGTRYRLLETVAAYALEQPDAAGETGQVLRRRDAHYAGLAEEAEPHLHGRRQRRWLERLDAEALNLRAALESAAGRGDRALALRLVNALAWYWYLRGRHREAHRSLVLAGGLPGPVCAEAVAWEAGFAVLTGDGTDPLGRSRAALGALAAAEAAEAAGAPDVRRARSRWFLALAHLHFGAVAPGKELLDEALAAFRALDDRWGEAAALSGRARQAVLESDLVTAERSGAESLALFTSLGDDWGRLQATDMLGYVAEVGGDYDRAARLHREGLRAAEALRLWTDVSYRLSSLGRIALLTGDFARSTEFHERAMRLAAEQSNRFAEEFARVGLGLVARRTGALDEAEAHFEATLAWNRRLAADYGVPFYGLTLLLAELGFVAELRGDAGRASALHREGLAAARALGDPRAVALAHGGLAGAAALAGDAEEAARLLGTAHALRASVGAPLPPAERGDVDRVTARARAALGDDGFTAAFRVPAP
ncbi:BTAD domain-containing putative transcriptional regulator [Streptomyces specialis]|uniref:BTAD domain-containing putative transcriptional regulator n=1 Tax=Streptomyces specialis TaxID=498367 RepID=UPI00073F1446|nr:BTAD domain-containing putative transcriptional regulator [Streptomyces specialis]